MNCIGIKKYPLKKLSLAISVSVTSICLINSPYASATEYFNSVNVSSSSFFLDNRQYSPADNIMNVTTYLNVGSTSATRNDAANDLSDAVVINPTAFATSNFYSTGSSIANASDDTNYILNVVDHTLSPLELTFATDADASSITKGTLTQYDVQSVSSIGQATSGTYTNTVNGLGDYSIWHYATVTAGMVQTSTTATYVSNVTFEGSNEIAGTITLDSTDTITVEEILAFGGDITAGNVYFNTDGSNSQTQIIGHNVNSAILTQIGNGTTTTTTTVNITNATGNPTIALGNADVTLVSSNVILNTASDDVDRVDTDGDGVYTLTFDVDSTNTSEAALGRLAITEAKTDSTFGSASGDTLTTNNATLNFTIGAVDYIAPGGAVNGTLDTDYSSSISGYTLTMDADGAEKINVAMLSSFKNGVAATLINTDAGSTTIGGGVVLTDNSFVIDTALSRNAEGDLITTTSRDQNSYVTKSGTSGHFSNNAAIVFGALGADGEGALGTNYSEDMQTVINKIDLDQWGYGNTQANLAVQAKSLAPIVNTSLPQTLLSASQVAVDTVGNRVSILRGIASGDEAATESVWIKYARTNANQDAVGDYDGYDMNAQGVTLGFDTETDSGLVLGAAFSRIKSTTDQEDFRSGDSSTTQTYQSTLYASKSFDNVYVDGSVTYARHSISGTRSTVIDRTAYYDTNAKQYNANLDVGVVYNTSEDTTVTPFFAWEYSRIEQKGYTETVANAVDLVYDANNLNRGTVGLGLKVASSFGETGAKVKPEFALGVFDHYGDDRNDVVTAYYGDNDRTKFTTPGSEMIGVLYDANLGLKFELSESSSISLNAKYAADENGDFESTSGDIALKVMF